MTTATISGKQMKRLQTLWGLFARQSKLDGKDREARLGWVAGAIGRQVASFKELTAAEAATAIEAVQKHLPPELLRRKRPSRDTARAYGTAGRKPGRDNSRSRLAGEIRMADAETWHLLEVLLGKLGWTRERLDAFLRSSKSPVHGKAIRTLAEANRVIWVLKSMLRRAETEGHAVPTSAQAEACGTADAR
jgi:hypothetical protein